MQLLLKLSAALLCISTTTPAANNLPRLGPQAGRPGGEPPFLPAQQRPPGAVLGNLASPLPLWIHTLLKGQDTEAKSDSTSAPALAAR